MSRQIMTRIVRPSPALFGATLFAGAATFLGAAALAAVPLLAESAPAQSVPAQSVPAQIVPAQSVPGPSAGQNVPGQTPPGPTGEGDGAEELAEPARALMGAAGRGECVWLGERAIGLMWKDDLDTAFRHLEMYDRFGCPGEHIQVGFRCVVRQGAIDQKDQKATDAFNTRVHSCWMNPALPAAIANAPAPGEKPAAK